MFQDLPPHIFRGGTPTWVEEWQRSLPLMGLCCSEKTLVRVVATVLQGSNRVVTCLESTDGGSREKDENQARGSQSRQLKAREEDQRMGDNKLGVEQSS